MKYLTNYTKQISTEIWMNTIGGRGELRNLKNETAIVLPDVLSINICRHLIETINKLADDKYHPRVWRDEVGSDSRIFGFEQDIEELLQHFNVKRWIEAIDSYTARKTKSWFLMANRVLPKENNLGSGGGLHRDSPFSHQVKCIWYLNDVTTENGPFQYIPGTHMKLLKLQNKYPLGVTRFPYVEDELVEVHAKAGSLLVCDTKCIHGGKPIQSGMRYAVTLYTFPTQRGAVSTFEKIGIPGTYMNHTDLS